MEISRVPARGLVLHHEEVFEFPTFRYPIIPQRATKEIQIGKADEVLWRV